MTEYVRAGDLGGPRPARDEQQVWLDEAMQQAKQQAFLMKRALDEDKMAEALKHGANMLNELRTSVLTPRNYYQLYMRVFDELRYLEAFFYDDYFVRKQGDMEKLYELVQHCGNILPRLYLLVTVGSCYIKSRQAPAKDILHDLIEMCRGVQQGTRGLFLRNYLLQLCKDKLPDSDDEREMLAGTLPPDNGSVQDSVDFILQNFHEMSKLWIRLEKQATSINKQMREQERMELRMLVGTNLIRLSQLEGVDSAMYEKEVLPRLLTMVISTSDKMAQQYFMECIIQVFPDEFHLRTLSTFLDATLKLHPKVGLKTIYIDLMDRLSNYYRSEEGMKRRKSSADSEAEADNMFSIFRKYVGTAIEGSLGTELAAQLPVFQSLATLAMQCYPENYEYVNEVLREAAIGLRRFVKSRLAQAEGDADSNNIHNDVLSFIEEDSTARLVREFLRVPVETYDDLKIVLNHLPHFVDVMSYLTYNDRKQVAVDFCRTALERRCVLAEPDHVARFMSLIDTLVRDPEKGEALESTGDSDAIAIQPGQFVAGDVDDEHEFHEEQQIVARMVHLMVNKDFDVQFRLFKAARKHFGQGGLRRAQYTVVPLVFSALRLCLRVYNEEATGDDSDSGKRKTLDKMLKFVLDSVLVLAGEYPDLCFRLYTHACVVADTCRHDDMCYEFITQAINVFENSISGSNPQAMALVKVIATLTQLQNLERESYVRVARQVCKHSRDLLKKADQSRAAGLCSYLFTTPIAMAAIAAEDGESTKPTDHKDMLVECVKQSRKLAEKDLSSAKYLVLVELLNVVSDHVRHGPESTGITTDMQRALLKHIEALLQEDGDEEFDAEYHAQMKAQPQGVDTTREMHDVFCPASVLLRETKACMQESA